MTSPGRSRRAATSHNYNWSAFFFSSSRSRHTRCGRNWSSDVCSSDLPPDPASMKDCTIGGNVATNAGGPRCLKYGVTRNYVIGLEVVLANGEVLRTGGRVHKNKTGFDLIGLFVGLEGMLCVVTAITLLLLPLPPARATLSAAFTTAAQAA